MTETITLNTQEQKRVMVLNRLLVGQLTAAEAAVLLNLSERQVRRLFAAYQQEGEARLTHGNRGRKPVQSISEEVRSQVIELATTTYAGCNYQHLRDLLAQRDGIQLSRASVRRIRLPAGIGSPRTQRRRQHRRRRARYAQEGMLVQIDGSRHAWLGDRGPWLTLIAAIDDATGKLDAAAFREQEDAAGYFLLVQQMLEQHGRPLALYHDRHGIFKQTSRATEADTLEEQLAGKQDPTQFGRRHGRIRDHLDCRSLAASQRARGTALWHPAGSAGRRAAPGRSQHPAAGQSGARRLPAALQCPVCSARCGSVERLSPLVSTAGRRGGLLLQVSAHCGAGQRGDLCQTPPANRG